MDIEQLSEKFLNKNQLILFNLSFYFYYNLFNKKNILIFENSIFSLFICHFIYLLMKF